MTADVAFWDNIAERYAAKPVDDPAAFDRKTDIIRGLLSPDHALLDVGCGTGSLALRLAPSAREVHGLDVSREMIRIARGKATASGAANATFHVGALGADAPFAPGTFDVVCACSLLHLVADRADALAHLFRLLKPGGAFVASTVCLGESWVPYAPILTVMRWVGKAPRVQVFPKRTLVDDITRAGFVDLTQPDVGAAATIGFMVARRPR